MHKFRNTKAIKQKIIHFNIKHNLFSVLSLKYQQKIWKMQVLGDVTMCHWASSSPCFEGSQCWQNNRNYSLDMTSQSTRNGFSVTSLWKPLISRKRLYKRILYLHANFFNHRLKQRLYSAHDFCQNLLLPRRPLALTGFFPFSPPCATASRESVAIASSGSCDWAFSVFFMLII